MAADFRDRLHDNRCITDRPKSSDGAPKECMDILAFDFWRGGKFCNPRKKEVHKREAHKKAPLKKEP
jgi:hypothetical protein